MTDMVQMTQKQMVEALADIKRHLTLSWEAIQQLGQGMAAQERVPHRTRKVEYGGLSAQIDVKLAPLIKECWKAGIITLESCQSAAGSGLPDHALISFTHSDQLERFVNVAAGPVMTKLQYTRAWKLARLHHEDGPLRDDVRYGMAWRDDSGWFYSVQPQWARSNWKERITLFYYVHFPLKHVPQIIRNMRKVAR